MWLKKELCPECSGVFPFVPGNFPFERNKRLCAATHNWGGCAACILLPPSPSSTCSWGGHAAGIPPPSREAWVAEFASLPQCFASRLAILGHLDIWISTHFFNASFRHLFLMPCLFYRHILKTFLKPLFETCFRNMFSKFIFDKFFQHVFSTGIFNAYFQHAFPKCIYVLCILNLFPNRIFNAYFWKVVL